MYLTRAKRAERLTKAHLSPRFSASSNKFYIYRQQTNIVYNIRNENGSRNFLEIWIIYHCWYTITWEMKMKVYIYLIWIIYHCWYTITWKMKMKVYIYIFNLNNISLLIHNYLRKENESRYFFENISIDNYKVKVHKPWKWRLLSYSYLNWLRWEQTCIPACI